MPVIRDVKIIKVPLSENERMKEYPKKFPRQPRLYLELLENKAKIKQDLINKEYVPVNDPKRTETPEKPDEKSPPTTKPLESKEKPQIDEPKDNDTRSVSVDVDAHTSSRSISESSSISLDSDSEPASAAESYSSEIKSKRRKKSRSRKSRRRTESENSEALSDRLKELLGGSSSEREDYGKDTKKSHSDKYSRDSKVSIPGKYTPYDKYKTDNRPAEPVIAEKSFDPPPTLAELEAKGHYQGKANLRDINHVGIGEYAEEDKKRELIFKFDLLKKSYPLAAPTIPEYTIHSDLRDMQKSYDSTVRRLSLDSTVESYKTYLLGGFMVVEFVFGNFLGFDMQGFTQQQIVTMHSYEKLLIELGEKSYVPEGSNWPVELRLLFLIIINAGIFIVGKMVMRKTGANLLGMMNSTNTPAQQSQPRQKRRMRGPNVNINDIPDAENVPSEA